MIAARLLADPTVVGELVVLMLMVASLVVIATNWLKRQAIGKCLKRQPVV